MYTIYYYLSVCLFEKKINTMLKTQRIYYNYNYIYIYYATL